ncbi:MAG: T9SS type A sorting domain-containing protein [Bacteroidetes bacterium]|nr:T9SS type A sorting domain-containing protein [Bacteroidota bacterium]MDA1269566.1 T9SS type A sorting domain-containing protein [Bacteroidota bacterium]
MNAQLLKLTFILLLGFPIFAGAQQVHVLSEAVDFSGKIGSSQRKTVILHNESAQPKTFLLRNIKGSIGSSQKMRLCLGDQCFDPKKDLAKVMLKLAPGEIYTDLYLEFELGIAETLGSFELIFVNSEALREFFVVEVKYAVSSVLKADSSNKDIKLGDIYPNPSNRVAQLDYTVVNPKAKAKITVTSFIGNPIAEYDLDPTRNSLVILVADFQPGVYFYTLFVDNKNVVTKKLQVKK